MTASSSDDGAKRGGTPGFAASPLVLDLTLPPLDLRSAALTIAVDGDDTRGLVTRALSDAHRHVEGDPFLAPALVEAIGLVAMRSPRGRSALREVLLNLEGLTAENPDARYQVISALRSAGRCQLLTDPDVVEVMQRLACDDDALVQAEARMQLAYSTLCTALQATPREELLRKLREAQIGFARARASEEVRPDAAAFDSMLDAILAFVTRSPDCDTVLARVPDAIQAWVGAGLSSDRTNRIAFRMAWISSALRRLRDAAGEAETWLRLDEALLELATVLADWQLSSAPSEVERALAQLSPAAVAPALGPLLTSSISRLRFERVILDAERTQQPAHIVSALRAMSSALAEQRDAQEALTPEIVSALRALAERRGVAVDAFVSEFSAAVKAGDDGYLTRVLPALADVPLDHPVRYSAVPIVDELATRLIQEVHGAGLLRAVASRGAFQATLVTLLEWLVDVRNALPSYLLCKEDGGLGQNATEGNVQDSVFQHLRHRFGWNTTYEPSRMAGGRADAGVTVEGRYFPLEAKREFHDVSREHIRAMYLAQTDAYAASTDGIGFLVVLDLRAINASAHRKNGSPAEARGMYVLADSVWLESLPADAGVTGARASTVIVLLVPGNRPKPSSMTTYSSPPAREKRKPE